MIDDVSDIVEMYNRASAAEDKRLTRHQLERDITLRYLTEYLPAQGSILEIGAATGSYTVELAKRGHAITAVDISSELIEKCRMRIANADLTEKVQFVVADARNLGEVGTKAFDAVLLMGPLYHLIIEEDRRDALCQAINRLKNGGLLFSAFISRLGLLGDMMSKHPAWIERRDEVQAILKRGYNPDNPRTGGFRGYFADVAEIRQLHESLGIQTVVLAGVEPAISANDEIYNRLEGEQRQLWLDLLYEVSSDKSIVGSSRHVLYIGKKDKVQ